MCVKPLCVKASVCKRVSVYKCLCVKMSVIFFLLDHFYIFPFSYPITSSDLHLMTTSHLQMLTSSSLHITHLHVFATLHTHQYTFICALYLYIFLKHLHILRHLHIFLFQLHISLSFSSLSGHPWSSCFKMKPIKLQQWCSLTT